MGLNIWGLIVPAISYRYYNLAIMKPSYNTGKTRDGRDSRSSLARDSGDRGPARAIAAVAGTPADAAVGSPQ